MLVNLSNTMSRGLLGLVNKQRNLLLAPNEFNFFNKNNHYSWFFLLLNILEQNHNFRNFNDIVGSSNNSIFALLIGLGYTLKEINQKIKEISVNQLLNKKTKYNKPLSIVTNIKTAQIKKQFKFSYKDPFLTWVQEQVNNKLLDPMATFKDLNRSVKTQKKFRNIHLIDLNIENGNFEIFNYKNTPDLPLAIAVRICISSSLI